MKKLFFSCLTGMSMLLPSSAETRTPYSMLKSISGTNETGVFIASSDKHSGELTDIIIYRASDMAVMRTQICGGYTCSISLVGLASGNYIAHVDAMSGSSNFPFTL
jgi:hypothetical protein